VIRNCVPRYIKSDIVPVTANSKMNSLQCADGINQGVLTTHCSLFPFKFLITNSPLRGNIIYFDKIVDFEISSFVTDIQVVSLIILQDCKKVVTKIDEWSDRRPF